MNRTDVVVGVDGSESSEAALRWAEREAERRHAALRIVAAYRTPWPGAPFAMGTDLAQAARDATEAVVAEMLAHARDHTSGVAVTGLAAAGGAVPVLSAAAGTAAVLVVGSRGHGGFTSLLLGSTGLQLATHAPAPVVVVHGTGEPRTGAVVVGTDCSDAADVAIAAAFEEASLRGCPVDAVYGYRLPVPPWARDVPPHDYDPTALRQNAQAALVDAVAPWWGKYPDVHADLVVTPADAADVLITRSKRARLIVVGTRGHGGFAGLLLGSVGQKLLHHAECPVLISRP